MIRLALPAKEHVGAPSNDVRDKLDAGVGDAPPRNALVIFKTAAAKLPKR